MSALGAALGTAAAVGKVEAPKRDPLVNKRGGTVTFCTEAEKPPRFSFGKRYEEGGLVSFELKGDSNEHIAHATIVGMERDPVMTAAMGYKPDEVAPYEKESIEEQVLAQLEEKKQEKAYLAVQQDIKKQKKKKRGMTGQVGEKESKFVQFFQCKGKGHRSRARQALVSDGQKAAIAHNKAAEEAAKEAKDKAALAEMSD